MTRSTVRSDATALRDETILRHVRRLGSARDGLSEWRLQRLTAIALIPLSLYFVASVLWLATSDNVTAAAWLSSPVTALLVMLFVLAGLAHALVGLRSVFLDYVHTRARLVAAGLFIRAAAVLLAGASILAVLKLFLGH
ncbi:MAG TPA: succinate dehydrogenase, hydrophobic membrane anchor protein [Bradyrhizobium sp.]|nr:succinate dehydrogenase, hydrophobic membrane anchor protein [Bradyrhizobium sp.]